MQWAWHDLQGNIRQRCWLYCPRGRRTFGCHQRSQDYNGFFKGRILRDFITWWTNNALGGIRGDVVGQCFAVLDACSSVIRESKPPSKRLAVALLQKFIEPSGIVCTVHDGNFSLWVMEDVCNGYFAGQAKRSREKVKEDCCPEKEETSESIDDWII